MCSASSKQSRPRAAASSSSATRTTPTTWSSKCSRSTASAAPKSPEIIPELRDYEGIHLPKRRYSAFYDTNLEDTLAELQPDRVIVCGVCTDICVMHTVADARNRDYPVDVPTDCVASFDPQAHENALKHMKEILGARLLPAKE